MYFVKVPGINGLGKTEGCEKAGNAILAALRDIYTNEEGKEINVDKLDLEEIHLNNYNIELTNDLIYKNSFETYETKLRTVFIGGDHSISFSLVHAFWDYCQNSRRVSQVHSTSSKLSQSKEPCLIVFDAHPDCMEPVDANAPTHEEWLRALIEKGFPAENVLLVGIRNSWKTETKFLKENEIKTISMDNFLENFDDACHTIMEFVDGRELYVSLDIDVVDPVFAPSTGHAESGGLSGRQMLYLIKKINKIKSLRAIDLVEINSKKDEEKGNVTVKLGAKIVGELI
jgi:agmatinase